MVSRTFARGAVYLVHLFAFTYVLIKIHSKDSDKDIVAVK